MLTIINNEVYSNDSDYSFIEDNTMEIKHNGVPFVEIVFSNDMSTSYVGLDAIKGTNVSQPYVLESAEYWLLEPTVSAE